MRPHHALQRCFRIGSFQAGRWPSLRRVRRARPEGFARHELLGPMSSHSYKNLKSIRFEGELLPNWAQLLDLASRSCPVSEETRHWFSSLTNSNGADDAKTALTHCQLLLRELQTHRDSVLAELRRGPEDNQAAQIFAAWIYALDTMIQQASNRRTCSWKVEGLEQSDDDESEGGGEITMRRV
jgi:hypothetical protein